MQRNFLVFLTPLLFGLGCQLTQILGDDDPGGSGGGDTTTTGGTGTCGAAQPVSYDACTGPWFVDDGTCLNGECATIPLETRVFAAWRAKTKALSGLSDAEFQKRVRVQSIIHSDGSAKVSVRIDYLVVLDWAKFAHSDGISLENMPLTNPPTDAEIESAVAIGVDAAKWTGLPAGVASSGAVQAAFDGCACGMTIDYCHIDFVEGSGTYQIRGAKQLDASQNQCKFARVDVATGQITRCEDRPCAVE